MTVHSLDGKSWLTKLERIGELAKVSKDVVFNNIGHCIDVNMLKKIYYQIDSRKAIGIDGVTKDDYGVNLGDNLKELMSKIRKGSYKPKPSRIVNIPKEDGSTRPLAISCLEDKLVQRAVSMVLDRIFEPIFLPCSYGYRPSRNCHDALRALNKHTFKNWDGAVVEIDIQKIL